MPAIKGDRLFLNNRDPDPLGFDLIAVDYLLILIVGVSAVVGLFRGFVKEAVSLLVWIAGIWCAWRFGQMVAGQLPEFIADPTLKLWATRLLILIVVLILGGLLSSLLQALLGMTGLTGTDRTVGMVFGLARGVVLAGLAVIMLELAGFSAAAWWMESRLIPYLAPMADLLRDAADEGVEQLQMPQSAS
jgi:membrane protein required for colicin V production